MNNSNHNEDLIFDFSEKDDALSVSSPETKKHESEKNVKGSKKTNVSDNDFSDTDEYEAKMIAIAKSGRGSSGKANISDVHLRYFSSPVVSQNSDGVKSRGETPKRRMEGFFTSKDNNNKRPSFLKNTNKSSGASDPVSNPAERINNRPVDDSYVRPYKSGAFSRGTQSNIMSQNDKNSVTRVIPTAPGSDHMRRNGTLLNSTSKPHGKKSKKGGYKGTALPSVLKAIIYIMFVLIVSGCLGYMGIMMGNDVFALVKSDEEIEVTIGEGVSIDELANHLKEQNVIKFPYLFKLYAMLRHDDSEFVAGTYTVSPSMNYDILRNSFQEQIPEVTTLSITIPEGYTVDQIIDLMVENGLGTKEDYIDAIQNYEFDYWFINDLVQKNGRKYRLEGYLYPDTYYFFSNSSAVQVLYKLLDRFDEIFPEEYKTECLDMGWSVDEIVCLASMIQMEAKYEKEYGDISSVFHNRLNNVYYETQGYLQSDATTQYALEERKNNLSGADHEIDSPYNTYKNKGLPPGPIANPSFSAITWALYPNNTEYFYFVAKSDGYSLFATNATDHAHNIITARGTG